MGSHIVTAMVFWQLTIDANDPALLARFWASVLGWQSAPPTEPDTSWWAHYRGRLDGDDAFDDRLFDPDGLRPPIWFQVMPEEKAGRNRLHLDVYVTARDNALSFERRAVETKVDELLALGATVERRAEHDDPHDPIYHVMHDLERNEFCVGSPPVTGHRQGRVSRIRQERMGSGQRRPNGG